MLTALTSPIVFVASFILVLSVLVFIHEMGHYGVARLFNVEIERFSIGFGKPILRTYDKSGTEWVISRWPLGGYVKFLGDAGAASNPDQSSLEAMQAKMTVTYGEAVARNCFHFKPLWQRALVVLAGPMANFILAIILFAIVKMAYGQQQTQSVVADVVPGSAAEAAGIQAGDVFLRMNGQDVRVFSDLRAYVALRSGESISTEVERNGQLLTLNVEPQKTQQRDFIGGQNGVGTIGVLIDSSNTIVARTSNPVMALGYGSAQVWRTIGMTGTYVKRMFQGREDGTALGGPLRIMTMTGKTSVDIVNQDVDVGRKIRAMIYSLLTLSAVLSIGLGIANLMPIPTLDGGHLLFYGYEALAGKPLSEAKQEFGFRVGFACLITLVVVLTINDISYIRSIFA